MNQMNFYLCVSKKIKQYLQRPDITVHWPDGGSMTFCLLSQSTVLPWGGAHGECPALSGLGNITCVVGWQMSVISTVFIHCLYSATFH